MAKKTKKTNLEMTPLMMLSVMAFFLMVPIVLSISNNSSKLEASNAAAPREVVVVSPTETPEAMEVMEN